jgi:hypothetical protein
MGWAKFWAIFSQTRPVTLIQGDPMSLRKVAENVAQNIC